MSKPSDPTSYATPRSRSARPPSALPRRGSPAQRFRAEIEACEAEGIAREDLVLHLTLGDVSQLKRDPAIAIEDISYAAGVMRFLGVRVEQGGIATSALIRPTAG